VRKLLRAFLALGAALSVGAAAFLWYAFDGPNSIPGNANAEVAVSRGQSFASVADTLASRGLVRSRFLFALVARLSGGAERIRVGRYLVADGMSNRDLFEMLRDGTGNRLIAVTIPEGLLARQQARIFARRLGLDSARFASLAADPAEARRQGLDAPSLEGYLMPDTYAFNWQAEESEVIGAMVAQFRKFWTDSLAQRAAALGWSPHEAVTMASIVEGETGVEEERTRIAGVYHNRLRKNMRLEADPTIQFMLEDGPRRVLYADLRREHPYNTYLNYGLPPGPVNNPGRASLLAALWPETHAYLFFVANGRGGHWFSGSYPEHQRYVRQYRRARGG
jgi:UPF0755 protein